MSAILQTPSLALLQPKAFTMQAIFDIPKKLENDIFLHCASQILYSSKTCITYFESFVGYVMKFVGRQLFLTNLQLFSLKVTQINYVSRNQLHNTANGCQILNFGLSWPGQGKSVKAKHCLSLKFSLLCTDTALTVTVQYWCSVFKEKHDHVFSVPC